MVIVEENTWLKLEGGSCTTTNNSVVSPVVIHNDASNVPNTVKLNGSNYPFWSKVLEMHIVGRGKKGFVTGVSRNPRKKVPSMKLGKLGMQL